MWKCWTLFLCNFIIYICNCSMNNIAINKPAQQSSSFGSYWASKAVDGIDGLLPSRGSCTHSAGYSASPPESTPWWEVDLQRDFFIHSVAVSQIDTGHPQLLHDFSIEVYGDGKTIDDAVLCYYHVGQATRASTELYMCNTVVKGRRLRITINGRSGSYQILCLCEVRVFGTQAVMKSSFQRFQAAELSDLPDMTYGVQGYGQCAMKCYTLPMCHIFSVKLMSSYYQCNIFIKENPKLVANSTGNPDILLFAI